MTETIRTPQHGVLCLTRENGQGFVLKSADGKVLGRLWMRIQGGRIRCFFDLSPCVKVWREELLEGSDVAPK